MFPVDDTPPLPPPSPTCGGLCMQVGCIGEGMPLASGESICAVCVVAKAICTTKPSLRLKSVSAENK